MIVFLFFWCLSYMWIYVLVPFKFIITVMKIRMFQYNAIVFSMNQITYIFILFIYLLLCNLYSCFFSVLELVFSSGGDTDGPIYIYIYICIYHIYVYNMYIYGDISTYIYTYTYTHVYMYIWYYMHIYIYIYIIKMVGNNNVILNAKHTLLGFCEQRS
jgi:hypothetical protein